MPKRIAIVGASIAGSVCEITLKHLGFSITLLEKSADKAIPDRGAGIWLPEPIIKKLIKEGFLSSDFPRFPITERPIYVYNATKDEESLLTSHPINSSSVHWMDLYTDLKKHRTEEDVKYNSEVTHIETKGEQVELIVNGKPQTYDGCIFADGGQSIGRRFLFPEILPTFTNTVIWRGTLDRWDTETAGHLLEKAPFYVSERGHLLIYAIPNKAAHSYKINWLFYEFVDPAHPLFREDPTAARRNVVKGEMTSDYLVYLHKLASDYLPPFPRQLILDTEQPFLQSMHEMLIPSYIKGNICLLGDASIMLRAHTAAGATKAIQDALALGELLQRHSLDIPLAFRLWNETQHRLGLDQFKLGQALGQLFVTNVPSWQDIKKREIDERWAEVISHLCWYASPTHELFRLLNTQLPNDDETPTLRSKL